MTTRENNNKIYEVSALMHSVYTEKTDFTSNTIVLSLEEKGLVKGGEEISDLLDALVVRGVLHKVDNFYSVL